MKIEINLRDNSKEEFTLEMAKDILDRNMTLTRRNMHGFVFELSDNEGLICIFSSLSNNHYNISFDLEYILNRIRSNYVISPEVSQFITKSIKDSIELLFKNYIALDSEVIAEGGVVDFKIEL